MGFLLYCRLKAANGKIIATSEGYGTKQDCRKGIEAVRRNLTNARLLDNT